MLPVCFYVDVTIVVSAVVSHVRCSKAIFVLSPLYLDNLRSSASVAAASSP